MVVEPDLGRAASNIGEADLQKKITQMSLRRRRRHLPATHRKGKQLHLMLKNRRRCEPEAVGNNPACLVLGYFLKL